MIELLGYATLGFFVAKWFAPLQAVKDELLYFFNNQIQYIFKRPNFSFKYSYVLYCSKCVTFWGTLMYTQDIFTACISAVLAYMIDFIVNYMNVNWEE